MSILFGVIVTLASRWRFHRPRRASQRNLAALGVRNHRWYGARDDIIANPWKTVVDTGGATIQAITGAVPKQRRLSGPVGCPARVRCAKCATRAATRWKRTSTIRHRRKFSRTSRLCLPIASLLHFICDYFRLIIMGSARPYEIEALMDEEIETIVRTKLKPYHSLFDGRRGLAGARDRGGCPWCHQGDGCARSISQASRRLHRRGVDSTPSAASRCERSIPAGPAPDGSPLGPASRCRPWFHSSVRTLFVLRAASTGWNSQYRAADATRRHLERWDELRFLPLETGYDQAKRGHHIVVAPDWHCNQAGAETHLFDRCGVLVTQHLCQLAAQLSPAGG